MPKTDSNGETECGHFATPLPPSEGDAKLSVKSEFGLESKLADSNGDHNLCNRYEIDKKSDSNGGMRSKDSNGEINLCTQIS